MIESAVNLHPDGRVEIHIFYNGYFYKFPLANRVIFYLAKSELPLPLNQFGIPLDADTYAKIMCNRAYNLASAEMISRC